MFRWYQKADVCYVYLPDISKDITLPDEYSEIARSRWFTRGWTLQELIAPSSLIFYSKEWYRIGTKTELCELLATITGIDVETLQGQDLEYISVAKRMCWASKRITTRVEDMAYCLLGIFDIKMPLLYGEGNKAFLRLQEEILKISGDHSLFAWGMPSTIFQLRSEKQVEGDHFDQIHGQKEISSERSNSNDEGLKRPLLQGLLADSPIDFSHSGNIIPIPWTIEGFVAPTLINRGIGVSLRFRILNDIQLLIGLPLPEQARRNGGLVCAALQCRIEDDYDNQLGLILQPLDIHSFGRKLEPVLVSRSQHFVGTGFQSEKMQAMLHIKPEKFLGPSNLDGTIVIHKLPSVDSGYILSGVCCLPPARYNERTRVLNPSGVINGALAAFIFRKNKKPIFAIVLGRVFKNVDTIADYILLREENSAADEDYMTESELLDFMTRRYKPSQYDETFSSYISPSHRLRVSITMQKSDWRKGAHVEFVRIGIE